MVSRSYIRFALNGHLHEVSGSDAFMMLGDYLRKKVFLTGTKIVCAEGDCGACTVLRAHQGMGSKDSIKFEPINSCIAIVAQLDGSHLVTVEALSDKEKLSPVQQAMVDCHSSQCGFCTPGFVMCLTSCLEDAGDKLDDQKIKNCLTGNLCRCTGYTPIIEAAKAVDRSTLEPLADRFVTKELQKSLREAKKIPIELQAEEGRFIAPLSLEKASSFWKKYPKAIILGSTTDLGVQINKGKRDTGDMISLHLIPELYKHSKRGSVLSFGAKVSLSQVRQICEDSVPEFSSLLDIFASPQIKNTATLVGNIVNASPIGDSLPFLLVADGEVTTAQLGKSRKIPLTELFMGYRKLALKAGELVGSVSFRAPKKTEVLRIYKASARKDLDISAVSAAFLFDMGPMAEGGPKIVNARLALGGVAAIPLRIARLESFLKGKVLDESTIDEAQRILQEEINPLSDVRGSSAYRRILIRNFFRLYTQEILLGGGPSYA